MEENNRKIEEAQKKLVSLISKNDHSKLIDKKYINI